LKQYKKEGVQKLVDVVNGDVKGLLNRFKTISKVSADYKSYSGISDSMNGKVDFIYKTDSIEE
jgi:putative membrane protein